MNLLQVWTAKILGQTDESADVEADEGTRDNPDGSFQASHSDQPQDHQEAIAGNLHRCGQRGD